MIIPIEIDKQRVIDPEAAANIARSILAAEDEYDRDKEHVWVIGLDTKNIIKYVDLVSLGTLNGSLVHPREVFRYAVLKGVFAIMVLHNHPSNDTAPSDADLQITKRLKDAAKILGIPLLDHIIISDTSHFSFKERGDI